jgi:DNA-binding NarL/FixJ family response regulator
MAKPSVPQITIPSGVYPILEKIIKSRKEEKRIVERALFIVRMAQGKPNTQIGAEFKVQSKTVKKWGGAVVGKRKQALPDSYCRAVRKA